jgi:hypothetical protein
MENNGIRAVPLLHSDHKVRKKLGPMAKINGDVETSSFHTAPVVRSHFNGPVPRPPAPPKFAPGYLHLLD